jgi:hypothetical protein
LILLNIFSDDAVLSSDDAVSSKRGAGGAGFASLDLIPVEINTALVFQLALAFSSGFLSIFFVDLVNVAMVDLSTIMFYGLNNGVQLSYGMTQGAYYTHDPK